MKMNLKATVSATVHTIGGVICAGVLLVNSSIQAQNVFVSNYSSSGPIYEFTPGGAQSTFVTG
jgi:hypothetical protein